MEDAFIFFKTAAAATQTHVFAVCLSLGTASETVSLVQKGRQLAEGSDLRELRVREMKRVPRAARQGKRSVREITCGENSVIGLFFLLLGLSSTLGDGFCFRKSSG